MDLILGSDPRSTGWIPTWNFNLINQFTISVSFTSVMRSRVQYRVCTYASQELEANIYTLAASSYSPIAQRVSHYIDY